MARVLPVPAPASTQTGPRVARATSRCSGSSPASSASQLSCTASATRSSCLIGAAEVPLNGPREGRGPSPSATELAAWEGNGSRRRYTTRDLPTTRRRRVSGQLTMYTTQWCGFCRNLKNQLARVGIEMAEVDIERDPAAVEFVMSVNGGNQTVPTVVFPDGSVMTNPSANQVRARLDAITAGQEVLAQG